jgi:hypothetical protein
MTGRALPEYTPWTAARVQYIHFVIGMLLMKNSSNSPNKTLHSPVPELDPYTSVPSRPSLALCQAVAVSGM